MAFQAPLISEDVIYLSFCASLCELLLVRFSHSGGPLLLQLRPEPKKKEKKRETKGLCPLTPHTAAIRLATYLRAGSHQDHPDYWCPVKCHRASIIRMNLMCSSHLMSWYRTNLLNHSAKLSRKNRQHLDRIRPHPLLKKINPYLLRVWGKTDRMTHI